MLKREIRILGLSAAEKKFGFLAVGVVYRGSLWLDGVVSGITKDREERVSLVSRIIKDCKQYSQLHAVILATEEIIPNNALSELFSEVKIPLIMILRHQASRPKPSPHTSYTHVRVNKNLVPVFTVGVTGEDAEKLFAICCNPSSKIPEAVRVAELIVGRATSLARKRQK